jgi:hypothetical protein
MPSPGRLKLLVSLVLIIAPSEHLRSERPDTSMRFALSPGLHALSSPEYLKRNTTPSLDGLCFSIFLKETESTSPALLISDTYMREDLSQFSIFHD